MGLSNYTPPRVGTEIAEGNVLRVRGVSLTDLAVLIREHLPDLDALAGMIDNASSWRDIDLEVLVNVVVSQMPGLAANAIALASDEPDSAPQAMMLPAPLQVKILTDVLDLTFREVGGIKKALETVAGLLQNKKMMDQIQALKMKATVAA